MAELENMPNVHEIASWCDFEESDDLAGLLHSLRAKATTKSRIFAAISQQLLEDNSELAVSSKAKGEESRDELVLLLCHPLFRHVGRIFHIRPNRQEDVFDTLFFKERLEAIALSAAACFDVIFGI